MTRLRSPSELRRGHHGVAPNAKPDDRLVFMKTILLVTPYWREQHRWMVSGYKLADLWQRLGYRVVAVCMSSESIEKTKLSISNSGGEVYLYRRKDFFLKDPWNYGISIGFGGYVARIAREEKPDFIVINKLLFWSSLAALSLRCRGYRVIQITDALVGITWWPRGKIPQICAAIYARTIGWILLLSAQRVVFFHPQPITVLRWLGIEKKSEVIPTGIDPGPYSDAAKLRAAKQGIIVTYVGRLESVKGVDDFLEAIAPLTSEFSELKVQVAGWYPEHHPLVEQYQRQVAFLGQVDDVAGILARTDIFVLPSHSEGLSNALMEAMSSSCACVASDVGGNRYLIENGVSGLLFPAGDREALRSHIRRLIQDSAKRKALGDAARARIDAVFSWEKVGKQYDELFHCIA